VSSKDFITAKDIKTNCTVVTRRIKPIKQTAAAATFCETYMTDGVAVLMWEINNVEKESNRTTHRQQFSLTDLQTGK